MKQQRIVVNDLMQRGYFYFLTEPERRSFHPDFRSELTPKELLALGVFGGKFAGNNRLGIAEIERFAPHFGHQLVAERFIQALQQECLDHFVILGQRHFDHLSAEYLAHYHEERPHKSLGNEPPDSGSALADRSKTLVRSPSTSWRI